MFRYRVVPGIFAQADIATDDKAFDFVGHLLNSKADQLLTSLKTREFGLLEESAWPNFGLPQSSTKNQSRWQKLLCCISRLNRDAEENVTYRLLFLARHGEGWHNVAEAKYGTEAWDDYWSKLDGADGMRFADAELTPLGRQQAQIAGNTWITTMNNGLTLPQSLYVSPLDRCLETCHFTFQGIFQHARVTYSPLVCELLREVIGEHTCDRRSSKARIQSRWPDVAFETGFANDDPFWRSDHRETESEQDLRLRQFMKDVFSRDAATCISFTAHSGAIRNLLRIIGHREFALQTGGVIPVLLEVSQGA